MKVLLVGVGGVGEAIAVIAKDKPWLEKMVLADYNLKRVKEVRRKLGSPRKKFPVEWIDAGDKKQIVELAKKYDVDLIMNAVDPVFNEKIFDAAYQAGCHYMDMAMTLSAPHPTDPFQQCGVKLGDYQFERAAKWEKKRPAGLRGYGRRAGHGRCVCAAMQKSTCSTRSKRSASAMALTWKCAAMNLRPTFRSGRRSKNVSIRRWCGRKSKGWFTTAPFSEPETFEFPEGIGPVECVNVEHEEVLLVPRWVKCKRVTFKYGLGDQFIGVLKTIKMLGLDNKDPINVKGVKVAPRDVVAACLPDPAHLGDRMFGKTCAGTWVKGIKGRPAAPGVSVSSGRQRDVHEEIWRAGRGVADRRQPGHRDGAARKRRVAGQGRAGAGSL